MNVTNTGELSLKPDTLTRLPCSDLVVGMFVAELDRPWKDTPFPINGFHIRKIEDLEALRRFCKHVIIDTSRGKPPKKYKARELTILSSARKRAPVAIAIAVHHDQYPVSRSVKQEIDHLEQTFSDLARAFDLVITNARDDKPLGLSVMSGSRAALLESLCRCPDAAVWMLNTQSRDACLLQHSLRAAIWASLLGRHIGLTPEELDTLLLGTLLADIGLTRFPLALVTRTGPFTRKQYQAYQKHVRIGEDILRVDGTVDASVIHILRNHHERHDGLGYPRGQQGEQIPLLGRIAHLAYSFDRLLKPFHAGQRVAPATAISRLYKQRMVKFMEQLVFEFIQFLGTHPAGTLVEVASHEVAVVLEQNPGEKLQPKMAVLLDVDKKPLKKIRLVNPVEDRNTALSMAITKVLPPGSHGIDVNLLREEIFGKRIGIGKFGIRF